MEFTWLRKVEMTRIVVWRMEKVGCEFPEITSCIDRCSDRVPRWRNMYWWVSCENNASLPVRCDSSGCDASLANPSTQSCWQYLDRFVHRLGNLPISMLVCPTHIKSSPCPRSQPTNLSSSISFSECQLRSNNPASNSPLPLKLSSQARSSPSQTSAQNHGLSPSVRLPST